MDVGKTQFTILYEGENITYSPGRIPNLLLGFKQAQKTSCKEDRPARHLASYQPESICFLHTAHSGHYASVRMSWNTKTDV